MFDIADDHRVDRTPVDVLASLRAQLDHDDRVGDQLNRNERARVESAVAMLLPGMQAAAADTFSLLLRNERNKAAPDIDNEEVENDSQVVVARLAPSLPASVIPISS